MERICTEKVIVKHAENLSKSIKAEVQFGTPSNKCKGVGICRVSTLAFLPRQKFQLIGH
ncbi:MAG: hypothetical protein HC912_06095 [Saprospiraceae bacterium]|nr:hypothetical protein [Saprospiraceae bacterium]